MLAVDTQSSSTSHFTIDFATVASAVVSSAFADCMDTEDRIALHVVVRNVPLDNSLELSPTARNDVFDL